MTPAQTALAPPACDVAPPLPKFVQIEPVGQCNLRCRMCAIQYRRDGPPHGPLAFLSFADFTRLVEGFGAIGVAFARRRLVHTSHKPAHVVEMLVTSFLIPWLSVYWRTRGALRYRVPFV
jgi:hypothetical protein